MMIVAAIAAALGISVAIVLYLRSLDNADLAAAATKPCALVICRVLPDKCVGTCKRSASAWCSSSATKPYLSGIPNTIKAWLGLPALQDATCSCFVAPGTPIPYRPVRSGGQASDLIDLGIVEPWDDDENAPYEETPAYSD